MNYLLNIFKIISLKAKDENILEFILNKIIDFYYQTIHECININLKSLPSTEGFKYDFVEDLYIFLQYLFEHLFLCFFLFL